MRECKKLHPTHQIPNPTQVQLTTVSHRHVPDLHPLSLSQQKPRHKIAVVLHFGQQNLVSGLQKLAAPGVRHQIHPLRSAPGEHHFLRSPCPKVARHLFPRPLIGRCGSVAQLVQTPVHIGVIVLVVPHQRIHHLTRLLRTGGTVQIHQLMPLHPLVQDGKIFAHRHPVHWVRLCRLLAVHRPTPSVICPPGASTVSSRFTPPRRS